AAAGAALVIPPSRYGEGIGYFSMMQALATGIGPFAAIVLTNLSGGYAGMFVAAAAVSVLALACSLLVTIPPAEARRIEPRHIRARGISSFVQLSVVPLGIVLFLVYFGYAGILSFVTSYADWRGLTDAVSLYFVVYAAVILITRPPVGRRVDRKGENSTIYACFASLAIGFVVLALAANGALLLASAVFAGFGIGAIQSIVQAVIARDTPPDELGKANSTFFMSMDLGTGIGPVAIGAILPALGYSGVYLLLAGVAVLAGIVYHIVHGRSRRNVPDAHAQGGNGSAD
ncbi:MAG TPA: MFS transporter, partial [Eggerthellaceae bacterium]|nr:MFS transporter [Eggerthellaceae bacterium]